MKKIFLLLILLPSILSAQKLVDYVNPFIGTGGHGHTFPGATAPFGFCQLSPDTRIDGSWDGCGGYHYSDSIIYGFSHTHLSGTGVSDYGDILLMPVTRKMRLDNYQYKSKFLHLSEKAAPGYYRVFLEETKVGVQLTTSRRCGFHKYTFRPQDETFVVLDLAHRDELLESRMHMVDKHTIRGYRFSKAWATNQKVFYEIKFEQEIERILYQPRKLSSKTHAIPLQRSPRALIKLKRTAKNGEYQTVKVKVGISGVDEEGARKNLTTEIPHWDFDKTKKWVLDEWEKELGKIQVSDNGKASYLTEQDYSALGGTKQSYENLPAYKKSKTDKKVIFYSALYHCMIAPNIYSDVDNRYRGRDDKIHSTNGKFDYYTVFSLWDTYRALHPLLTIIDKKRTNDFINTFIKQYEQGGRLPVWELSSNETNCMIGYHAVSVIWDAYNKGIRDYDAEKAFEAMKSIATEDSEALKSYMKYGYVRAEDDHESVSKTLEYAYDDWCIAQMAKALGKEEDYETFEKRSHNWINVYDPTTGFMRARKNSTLIVPFSPYLVDNNYTEANSWQYSFYVPHNTMELLLLAGSNINLESKLDSLFAASTITEGRKQSDITGLIGQYAHGNEPSHNIAYLYHLIGAPRKGNRIIKKVLKKFYSNAPDGYIGNEDCGQMSAWYVLNSLGFYSYLPGTKTYVANSVQPLYEVKESQAEKLRLKMGTSTIKSNIVEIEFDAYVINSPKYNVAKDASIELSNQVRVSSPFIYATPRCFIDSQVLRLGSNSENLKIYYSLNDGITKKYDKPILIKENSNLKFHTAGDTIWVLDPNVNTLESRRFLTGGDMSPVQTATFTKLPNDRKVYLNCTYGKTYHAGGPMGLVDGIHGKKNWRAGDWQGYQGQDFEAVIALDKPKPISNVTATFLQDQRAWIFYPTEVDFYFSIDSVNWDKAESWQDWEVPRDEENITIKNVSMAQHEVNKPFKTKYIKVKAKNYGKLPNWHPGRGNPAYIFIDEIAIK